MRKKRITLESDFSKHRSYKLRSFLVKSCDDLRQEFIVMEMIRKVREVLLEAGVAVKIHAYDIIPLSAGSGLIEFLSDTRSIDSLKKSSSMGNLLAIYRRNFGLNLDEALDNFMRSLAGYSLLQYLLMIKDRHNGNILIDSEGCVVHIDFGFVLGHSPGGLNFENSPFKFTREYVEMLGGRKGRHFEQFQQLLVEGLKATRKHSETILSSL